MYFIRSCFCAALFGALLQAASADTVWLENGDRLTGTVLEVREGKVALETSYAGTVSIALEQVHRLDTDAPRAVQMNDGTVITAPLQILAPEADDPGEPGGDTLRLERSDVAAVAADASALVVPPPSPWSGTIGSGLSLRSGNTDTFDVRLDTALTREKERHTLVLKLGAAYGEADGELNTRRHKASARWQYYPKERFFIYLLGGLENDDGRKLDLRLNAASGVGYDLIDRERTRLSGDVGLEFVHEEWAAFTPPERTREKDRRRTAAMNDLLAQLDALARAGTTLNFRAMRGLFGTVRDIRSPLRNETGREEDFVNLRLGLSLEKDLFSRSKLTNEFIAYPNLDEFREIRLTNELALVTPLLEKLDIRVSLLSEFDSKADESGVEAWDNTLRAGVQYAF